MERVTRKIVEYISDMEKKAKQMNFVKNLKKVFKKAWYKLPQIPQSRKFNDKKEAIKKIQNVLLASVEIIINTFDKRKM